MFKKALALVGVILAVAIAAPVAALANWTHKGSEIAEEVEVEMQGPVKIQVPGILGADFDLDLKGSLFWFSTTGQYTAAKITNCFGTGSLAGLRCTGVANGLPWIYHWKPFVGIKTTKGSFTLTFYGATDLGHVKPVYQLTTGGDFLGTVDNTKSMSSMTLSGEGMKAGGFASTLSGELEITPAETYGGE